MASKYTKELLEPIVKESFSYREVARRLGIKESTIHLRMKPKILDYGIDVSHFRSHGVRKKRRYTDEEVFVIDSPLKSSGHGINGHNSGSLTTRLKRYKPYSCAICNNTGVWQGTPLTLQVDHINGCNTDNRLDNLRWLCPNCHTQQPTSFGKKRKEQVIDDKTQSNN